MRSALLLLALAASATPGELVVVAPRRFCGDLAPFLETKRIETRLVPLEEALTLLTADHGEALMEYEMYFGHGYQVYESIIRVPLLIRGPGLISLDAIFGRMFQRS